MTEPIAYTFEADHHCPACTFERFGQDENGHVPADATDDEENPVGAVFPWDEWWGHDELVEVLTCGDCHDELARVMNEDGVRDVGREAGRARGTWVEVDGPTEAAAIVNGYEDGDPEVMDMSPAPLSGEWAGESIPELSTRFDIPLEDEEVADLFEEGYSDGFWSEVLRACREVLVGSTFFDRFDIAEAFSVYVAEWSDPTDSCWVAKSTQLRRIEFRARPNLSRSTLSPNGLGILLRLEAKDAA